MKRVRLVLLFALLAVVLNACGSLGASENPTPPPVATEPNTHPGGDPPSPTPVLPPEKIAALLRPSTVMVRADFPETAVSDAGYGSGTGIMITADGYIVTNAHVVEGASAVTVAAAGSSQQRPARVVGRSSCDDLAVLKVDNVDGLKPATLGRSSALQVGEQVYAMGYPLGDQVGVEPSFTQGAVSKHDVELDQYQSLIQTDATINPGNSGGPLINQYGEVVGINSLGIHSDRVSNINFAISIDAAKSIIEHLQSGSNQQWLGLNLVPNTYKKYFGTEQGMVVAGVDSGSPAAKAGILPASLLLALENSKVNSMADVCKILRSHGDGDQLKVKLFYTNQKKEWLFDGEVALGAPEQTDEINPQPIPAPTPAPQANFSDDFSSNTSGWDTNNSAGLQETLSDGAYTIILKRSSAYVLSQLHIDQNIPNSAVAVDVLVHGNARAGVALRHSKNQQGNSYIACWIDGGNQYGCFVAVNNQLTTLAEATTSDAIQAGQVNRVALQTAGQQIKLLINGKLVANFTDNRVATGVPALYVENFDGAAGASFDNLALYLPK